MREFFLTDNSDTFGIPIIPKPHFAQEELQNLRLLGFNRIKQDKGTHRNRMVHFFLYDYNFEKIWNNPEPFVESLRPYRGVLTPDFSMYTEMPYAIQLYNTFRNRWCGAYLAQQGLRVVPTVNWGTEESFDFCFAGIEKGSIVAVSTYMFHEHGNRSDQKELFLNGYRELLQRIEPEYVICYSEPFPEMEGNLIYVDYELSSWQHMEDDIVYEKFVKRTYDVLTKPPVHDIIIKTGYVCKGGGSAFGGNWKPKSESDKRLIGKPGEIKTSFVGGYKRDTLIGDNGYATKERHYSTAPNPKYHSNPHDHAVTWENNHPNFGKAQNYWDGIVPILKHFNLNYVKVNNVDLNFRSLSEAKESILYGGELVFSFNEKNYSVFRQSEQFIFSEADGSNEVRFNSLNEFFNHTIDESKICDILKTAEILDRNL